MEICLISLSKLSALINEDLLRCGDPWLVELVGECGKPAASSRALDPWDVERCLHGEANPAPMIIAGCGGEGHLPCMHSACILGFVQYLPSAVAGRGAA